MMAPSTVTCSTPSTTSAPTIPASLGCTGGAPIAGTRGRFFPPAKACFHNVTNLSKVRLVARSASSDVAIFSTTSRSCTNPTLHAAKASTRRERAALSMDAKTVFHWPIGIGLSLVISNPFPMNSQTVFLWIPIFPMDSQRSSYGFSSLYQSL